MPARRKSTRRATTAREAQQEQGLQKPEGPPQATQRPQTRAWIKQEEQRKQGEQRKKGVVTAPSSYHLRSRKSSPKQASVSRYSRTSPRLGPNIGSSSLSAPVQAPDRPARTNTTYKPEKRKDLKPSCEEERKHPLRKRQLIKEPIQDSPLRSSRISQPQRQVLSAWLDQLQTASPEDSRVLPPVNDLPSVSSPIESGHSMESSSSASRTSQGVSEGRSTVKAPRGPRQDNALSWEKLRLRRIRDKRSDDERSEHFKSVLSVKPIRIRFKDITSLQSILRDFLQRCEKARPNEDSYAAIEDLLNQISGWRPGVNLVAITNREFNIDLNYCKNSNEAVLQRTVMTSIIDRWHLHDLFVYNCEGQWKLQDKYRLPTRSIGDVVSFPKPDLAVSFTLEAFTGPDTSSPFPKDIGQCMRPDGDVGRCFPFFFMEVKRGTHDLKHAFMANLHSASQALFNIYVWMLQAGHQEIFFERVRVFSIVLNTQEISMRVHRAVPLPSTTSLTYHFDDIVTINGYSRDQACLLFRNVLIEYGEKELYGILKSTFEEVSRQEDESKKMEERQLFQGKRKADPTNDLYSKKVRSVEGAAESLIDASSSFGASGLEIT